MENMEKKKLWIYIAIAYGVAALMSIAMFVGFRKEYDVTLFVNVQMMYPACGVIIGKMITKRDDEKLPVAGFITVLVTTALMMLTALASVLFHIKPLEVAGQTIEIWNLISQMPLMAGSVITYILFWTCGREKRENAGLERKNIKVSIIMIAVFVILLVARCMIAVFLVDSSSQSDEQLRAVSEVVSNPLTWVSLAVLPVNFIFAFIAFFGEEYGWRYYLQPLMQGRFGRRAGVLLLGIVWAVWHINVDFMYYAEGYGLQAFVCQIITCVAMAVFFGYAYMKTGNIMVPIIMHYLNNNIVAIIGGGGSDALTGQVITWKEVPVMAVSYLIFFLFILAPIYKKEPVSEAE